MRGSISNARFTSFPSTYDTCSFSWHGLVDASQSIAIRSILVFIILEKNALHILVHFQVEPLIPGRGIAENDLLDLSRLVLKW